MKRRVKERRGAGKTAFYLFPALCAGIFVLCVALYLPKLMEHRQGEDVYRRLNEETICLSQDEDDTKENEKSSVPETEKAEEKEGYPLLDIDYEKLRKINADFAGVLYIPVLDICYPVVQGKDNREYLTKDFGGETNINGAVFLDAFSSADLCDPISFIFAHNMASGAMFGKLKTFCWDEKLADKDPWFYLYREDGVRKYRIIGYGRIASDDPIYDINESYKDSEGYRKLTEKIREVSLYDAGKDAEDFFANAEKSPVVALSTCCGTGHRYSFIVFGMAAD